ncbi:MAG: flagellin [Aliihoeflea sp.]
MSSLHTNAASMTALQTLSHINKGLGTTQNRISTGFRVAEASDNAAYWSIATTMRSDNKALSTVQDALGLGSATVDTAYTGLTSAIEVVDEIKTKLVASLQPGVDRDKIQSEITQLKEQLTSIGNSASFNGQNWLSVDSNDAGWDTRELVSSFTRDGNNTVTVGMTSVNVGTTALFDAGNQQGILDGRDAVDLTVNGDLQNDMAAGDGTDAANVTLFGDMTGGVTIDGDASISFNLVIDGTSQSVMIDKATVDAALSSTDGVIADAATMVTVVNYALTQSGISVGAGNQVSVAANGNAVEITHEGGNTAAHTLAITDATAVSEAGYDSMASITIDNATSNTEINGFITSVDRMLSAMTTAASDLGAIKSRIDMQQTFASKLTDAIDRGVGQLVDADMTKESARLSALQVQQQLGIQALSIANSNAQNLLSLFR